MDFFFVNLPTTLPTSLIFWLGLIFVSKGLKTLNPKINITLFLLLLGISFWVAYALTLQDNLYFPVALLTFLASLLFLIISFVFTKAKTFKTKNKSGNG